MSDDDEKREVSQRGAARMHDQMMKRVGPDSRDTFDDIERRAEESERMLLRALLRGRLPGDKRMAGVSIGLTTRECAGCIRCPWRQQ